MNEISYFIFGWVIGWFFAWAIVLIAYFLNRKEKGENIK